MFGMPSAFGRRALNGGLARRQGGGVLVDFSQGSLPAGVTVSRASQARYINSSGVLSLAANDTARIDYNPVTGAFRGLMVEPMASNFVTRSNDFSTGWSGAANAGMTVTGAAGTGPDGTTSASNIVPNAVSGFHDLRLTIAGTTGRVLATAIVKANGYRYYVFNVCSSAAFAHQGSVILDTTTGGTTSANTGAIYVVESKGARDLGGGWWEVWSVVNVATTAPLLVNMCPTPNSNGSTSFTGNGSGALLYSFQVEPAYRNDQLPTGLIATSGSIAQRQPELVSFTIPAGVTGLRYLYDDGTTQTIGVVPGPYTIPTNIAKGRRIRAIYRASRPAGCRLSFYETDWSSDIDDALGLQILMAEVFLGKTVIIGANTNSADVKAAPSLATMLRHCGFGQVPVGAHKETSTPATPTSFNSAVVTRFGTASDTNANPGYPDAVTNLRTVLAAADAPVYLLNGGFCINLSGLLQSAADGISPLTGLELVAAKIAFFQLDSGRYPSGQDYNFNNDRVSSAYVLDNWPSSIPIVGVDDFFGATISTTPQRGDALSNPFVYSYQLWFVANGGTTRPTWGALGVLNAVNDDPTFFNYQGQNGTNTLNTSTGVNTWSASPVGNFSYLGNAASTATIAARIAALNELTS